MNSDTISFPGYYEVNGFRLEYRTVEEMERAWAAYEAWTTREAVRVPTESVAAIRTCIDNHGFFAAISDEQWGIAQRNRTAAYAELASLEARIARAAVPDAGGAT